MTTSTQKISDAGVSLWFDDLSRERITTGNLQELIDTKNVVGITTNPTIFAGALSNGESYAEQVKELAAADTSLEDAVFTIMADDVQKACDVFAPIYNSTQGRDGRVSLEVDPGLARDSDGTAEMAKSLAEKVNRENLMIKIPATEQGLEPIAKTLAEGISVNVTLIFSLERYRAVMNAYMIGLEKALENGKNLSKIHSVASFFISRVDSEIDAQLDAIGTEEAKALKGKAGLANARLAYQAFEETFSSERWERLAAAGANVQRPLWASTGTKDPAYPADLYVSQLVAPNTVNTVPAKTLDYFAEHGEVVGDTISGTYDESNKVLNDIEAQGVSYNDVVKKLEDEGIEKFDASWAELLETVKKALVSA
ncbi:MULTISPECIES: transaldolase [Rothia]|uniref:Transaldolase n=2 Tax=Rothia TaxID=32207 RepID=A0A7H2BHC2_9MICC|nr:MULTISPECIES: transaldolase [Rothia]QNV39068.1 transaldolase [Rothia amarae]SIL72279.1 transaldolase [Mycobacteroides abscessus subsp. abscessus]